MRFPVVTRVLLIAVVALSAIAELFKIYKVAHHTYSMRHTEAGTPPPAAKANFDAYYIVLVLGKTPIWILPLTLVTTSLIEVQLLPFLILLLMLATGGRYCEKVWGGRSYLTFAATLLLGTTILEMCLYGALSSGNSMVCGANGLVAGIAVALKQLVPAHTVVLLRGRIRIPLKWAPVLFLAMVSVLTLVSLEENLLAYYMGFVASWFYLRYIQRDASDAMCFANFFPSPLSTMIEPLLNAIYRVYARVGLRAVPALTTEEIHEANQRHAARLTGSILPMFTSGAMELNGVRATNERRKMMLRQLDSPANPVANPFGVGEMMAANASLGNGGVVASPSDSS